MNRLVCEQTCFDSTVIVEPAGEVDLSTAAQLETALLASIADAKRVVVRLDRMTFLDSMGITALVTAFKAAHARDVVFCLAAPHSIVAKALRVTAIDTVMPTYADVDGALDATEPAAH